MMHSSYMSHILPFHYMDLEFRKIKKRRKRHNKEK